jgi:uncharacterized membrane protein YhhN
MEAQTGPLLLAVFVTVAGVCGCFFADRSGRKIFEYIGKPSASLAFLGLGLHTAGDGGSAATTAILVALALSLVGDVALMFRTNAAFLAGLSAFLLGHLGFVVAFVLRGISVPWALALLPIALLVAVPILRWLLPHVPGEMRAPVLAYIGVITAMVVCAVGTHGHAPAPGLVVAAMMFFVSDIAVARQQFVVRDIANRYWGLPLYFGGQLVFAANVLS